MRHRRIVSGHAPDYRLMTTVGLILLIGLVMLSSASTAVGYERFGDSNYFIKHQLFYGVLFGLLGFWIASKVDYHFWQRWSFPLLIGTIVLLILVFVPGIGLNIKGAHRWINLGFSTIQPAEIAKLTFLFYLANWLQKRGQGVKNFLYGFLPFIVMLGLVASLILKEPDFSTMLILCVMAVGVYFVGGANPWHVGLLGLGSSALFYLMIKFEPYRADRFTVFLNPESDPQGIGYHINRALLAIGSGGWFGLGLGNSRQKYNSLPEVQGDSIFAVIAEEMGLIFSLGLIVLFGYLMLRGFRIARQAPDNFSRYVSAGIVIWIAFQAFFNIAAMVGIVPLTGIPLPFISHGSTAVVSSLFAMGVLVNISKQTVATSRPA
jgi:cell division protein FtsW